MPYVKIWIHAVWGTKNHNKLLSKDLRTKLFKHIKNNAKDKDIYVDFINGYFDHVHCLLTLRADLSISKVVQLLKGESAYWANNNALIKPKLEWADEYFAVSVSESIIPKVRHYIRNQEEHHKVKTFLEEYDEFIKSMGMKRKG